MSMYAYVYICVDLDMPMQVCVSGFTYLYAWMHMGGDIRRMAANQKINLGQRWFNFISFVGHNFLVLLVDERDQLV